MIVSMLVSVIVIVAATVAVPLFVFAVIVKIPVAITIPVMVVLNSTSPPAPVAHKVSLAIVVRWDPIGSFIGRHRPVTLMPPIMVADRIPVAFHPYIIGSRWWRLNNHTRRRWGSDLDPN